MDYINEIKTVPKDYEFLTSPTKRVKNPRLPKYTYIISLMRKVAEAWEKKNHGEVCLGLAANQVGFKESLAILRKVYSTPVEGKEDEPNYVALTEGEKAWDVIFNPEFIAAEGGLQKNREGCLSCPGDTPYVIRPEIVSFRFVHQNGQRSQIMKAWGLGARVITHEIDHLKGRLIYDSAITDQEAENIDNPKPRPPADASGDGMHLSEAGSPSEPSEAPGLQEDTPQTDGE